MKESKILPNIYYTKSYQMKNVNSFFKKEMQKLVSCDDAFCRFVTRSDLDCWMNKQMFLLSSARPLFLITELLNNPFVYSIGNKWTATIGRKYTYSVSFFN